MAEGVRETVHFIVTVRSVEYDDHWIATALETGVIAAGKTRAEAEERNGKAHVMLIRRIKQDGRKALEAFMDARDMRYAIGQAPPPDAGWQDDHSLPLAA